jgi:hypothetical protein
LTTPPANQPTPTIHPTNARTHAYTDGEKGEKGEKGAAALRARLAALEARFWDGEAVAAALAREVEEVLNAYDDVVRVFGFLCVVCCNVCVRERERERGEGGGHMSLNKQDRTSFARTNQPTK